MISPGDNVDVVRRLFAGLAADGLDSVLPLVHEDCVLVVPPEVSAEPDIYRGHDGARRYFAGFGDVLADVSFEATGLEEHGDAVVALTRMRARGGQTEIEVEQLGAVLIRLREGRVTMIDVHTDAEAARLALHTRTAAPPGSA